MELFGEYDVLVTGAGITGVVASISAARMGARTLLVEAGGNVGGMITGGRVTKPTGEVLAGIYRELLDRAAALGGADAGTRESFWGSYRGLFDPEIMQRVILDAIDDAGVEVLLFAQVVDVVVKANQVRGLRVRTRGGDRLILGHALVDASGDGDVAALAGASFMLGRSQDGLTQPISTYMRVVNVDIPELIRDCDAHRDDLTDFVIPDHRGEGEEDYRLVFFANGFTQRIEQARREGFRWLSPRNEITLKAGLIPGEVNVNATRFHGNALDDRVRSQAALELRRQAYSVFDFLRRYVGGFRQALLLEVAQVLGVRETRRIRGRYVLTGSEVRSAARFEDAIGLSKSAIDIHEPGGPGVTLVGVGPGYGIPYRCLLPEGIEGLLVAGRCLSVDEVAFGSTRNTPACAITGEAAGVAAALAAAAGLSPSQVDIRDIQAHLARRGIPLGRPEEVISG